MKIQLGPVRENSHLLGTHWSNLKHAHIFTYSHEYLTLFKRKRKFIQRESNAAYSDQHTCNNRPVNKLF